MAEKKAEKKPKFVTVNCPLLNVRIKPDLAATIVKQVSEGEKLEKLGTAGKGVWVKVPDGYVMAEFVC